MTAGIIPCAATFTDRNFAGGTGSNQLNNKFD